MSIYFLETEAADRAFFQRELAHAPLPLRFVNYLYDVEEDAQVVSSFIYTSFGKSFFESHPALRLIATRSTAWDHIDLPAAQAREIAVANVPRYGETTVAEHTFALILALSRRLRPALRGDNRVPSSREAVRGFDLHGKTLGLIGAGRIGQRVIGLARAFGMRVLAFDPFQHSALGERLDFQLVELDRILAESDVLTLHAPARAETHHILNAETLARCRRGVIVINTARGGLIDTSALIDALDSGHVAGAGLDVLEEEKQIQQESSKIIAAQIVNKLKSVTSASPLQTQELHAHEASGERLRELENLIRNKALLSRPEVVFTPHIAFNSVEAVARINSTTVENIRGFLGGGPVNLVPAA